MRSRHLLPILFLLATSASAQPLADRLPPSTLVYTGWSPTAALQTTAAAKMLADVRFVQPWRVMFQSVMLSLPDELAAGGAKVSEHLPKLLTEAAQCEGCFALLDLASDKGHWSPRAVLIINLGARRKTFEEHFQPIQLKLKDRLGDRVRMMKLDNSWLWMKSAKDRSEFAWGFFGDSFVFYLGEGAEQFLPTLTAAAPAKSLKTNPSLVESLAKLTGGGGTDALLTTYVDGKRFVDLIHQLIKDTNNSDFRALDATWPRVVASLGLDNLVALVERTTVQDARFITRSLLRTEGAPHGLLAAVVQPPVDDVVLKLVPADAMFAVAGRMDLARAYDDMKAAIIAVMGEDGRKGFGDIEDAAAGFGIPVNNLLSPLGDQWVLYESASTGGFFFTGLTLIVDVKDEAKLARTLVALKAVLAHQFGADARPAVIDYEADGVTYHYVQGSGASFTPFAPAWAVADKKLFIALYPQVIEDAIRQSRSDKSLLDNPAFTAARAQTGGGGPLLYLSNPEFIKSLYPIVLPLISAVREFGAMSGGDANAFSVELLPSLQRLLSYSGADAVSISLTPDGVLRIKSSANPLLSPLTPLDSIPLWVAAALPSLAGSSDSADRTKSAANLRQIGQALQLYSVDTSGKLPADLNALVTDNRIDKQLLHSPFGEPDPAAAPAPDKASSDYRYLATGLKAPVPPDVVVAYDAAELTKGDGANLLYGDGHVEWLDHDGVTAALDKSTKWRQSQKPGK